MARPPLDLFPAHVPIGYVLIGGQKVPVMGSSPFVRSLEVLHVRVGGTTAPSITDLAQTDDDDSALEELRHETWKGFDAQDSAPPVVFDPYTDPLHPLPQEHVAGNDVTPIVQEHAEVQQLLTELAGLREDVNALRTEINDLRQGVSL